MHSHDVLLHDFGQVSKKDSEETMSTFREKCTQSGAIRDPKLLTMRAAKV